MSAVNIITSFLPSFFYSQFFVTPKAPTTDCTGKTIIVTGANTGLGREAARHFVRLNAEKVIIACRSTEKGEIAKKDLEGSTGRTGVVEVWNLDLQDYDSVRQFATKAQSLQRIDSLVENAGINTSSFKIVADHESTLMTNVVSTFLLALLLLPKLQETGRRFNIVPTLTVVSSELHFVTSFPERQSSSIFGSMNDPKQARMGDRYQVSKLLEVLICREIAREHPIEDVKVTINFVNPGWCHSELAREMTGLAVKVVTRIFCRSTELGSRTLVHAGLSGPNTHGKYLSNCAITQCAPLVEGSEGLEIQRRVWKELAEILEKIEPGVVKKGLHV